MDKKGIAIQSHETWSPVIMQANNLLVLQKCGLCLVYLDKQLIEKGII